ncbi:SDR family oxidoreductase [Kluyvera cryocrescens]|uniref:SDR family oxidoreductase n=1 Tax=Kluyvera cryocrescens TaxID=580 RepID=UPI0039F6AC4C
MRIFLTGATGFIGSHVARELIAAGHQVLGLTRSTAGAEQLIASGAEVHFGNIEDLDSLQRGAIQADGVIHTAFNHDFSTFVANCEHDYRVIDAMGTALEGTQKPLIITSGVAMGSMGQHSLATEDNFNADNPNPRRATELAGLAVAQRGVHVSVVRLPQVHDTNKQGLITPLIELARQKGVSGYVEEGQNRWSAVHVSDVAAVYLRALENTIPNRRYHAVAEEGIPMRTLAEVIGYILDVPVKRIAATDAAQHFGWMSMLIEHDMSASGALTRERLAWQPTGPGLIEDLLKMRC